MSNPSGHLRCSKGGAVLFPHIMALIYQMNVQRKSVRTTISTQGSAFIDLEVSVGFDQISRQV